MSEGEPIIAFRVAHSEEICPAKPENRAFAEDTVIPNLENAKLIGMFFPPKHFGGGVHQIESEEEMRQVAAGLLPHHDIEVRRIDDTSEHGRLAEFFTDPADLQTADGQREFAVELEKVFPDTGFQEAVDANVKTRSLRQLGGYLRDIHAT